MIAGDLFSDEAMVNENCMCGNQETLLTEWIKRVKYHIVKRARKIILEDIEGIDTWEAFTEKHNEDKIAIRLALEGIGKEWIVDRFTVLIDLAMDLENVIQEVPRDVDDYPCSVAHFHRMIELDVRQKWIPPMYRAFVETFDSSYFRDHDALI